MIVCDNRVCVLRGLVARPCPLVRDDIVTRRHSLSQMEKLNFFIDKRINPWFYKSVKIFFLKDFHCLVLAIKRILTCKMVQNWNSTELKSHQKSASLSLVLGVPLEEEEKEK